MGWGWQRGSTSRSRRRGRGKKQELLLLLLLLLCCCLPAVKAGRPRNYWSCAAKIRHEGRHDGTCGLRWMETTHCMHRRQVHALAGPGNWAGTGVGEWAARSSHRHLNDSQCQRRTCGINLEPMQCRVRGRQSLLNGKRRRDGPHTGSQIRVAGSAGREQGASSRELAAHIRDGWSDGWPIPYKRAFPGTVCTV